MLPLVSGRLVIKKSTFNAADRLAGQIRCILRKTAAPSCSNLNARRDIPYEQNGTELEARGWYVEKMERGLTMPGYETLGRAKLCLGCPEHSLIHMPRQLRSSSSPNGVREIV